MVAHVCIPRAGVAGERETDRLQGPTSWPASPTSERLSMTPAVYIYTQNLGESALETGPCSLELASQTKQALDLQQCAPEPSITGCAPLCLASYSTQEFTQTQALSCCMFPAKMDIVMGAVMFTELKCPQCCNTFEMGSRVSWATLRLAVRC